MHKQNEENIAYYESRKGGIVARLVRKCTAWAWKHQVLAPTLRLYERGCINSIMLHESADFASRVVHQTLPNTKFSRAADGSDSATATPGVG